MIVPIFIITKSNEILLSSLSIPFDDTAILGTRVDIFRGYLDACDAAGVSLI